MPADGGRFCLSGAGRLDELHFGPERVVEFVRPERSGMQRPGDEFPERLELLKLRLVGIVVMRGGVMHVRGQPHRVGDAGGLDEAQDVGDLEFAAARRAVALRKRFRALFVGGIVIDDQAERHVGGDHLPGGARIQQRALQPGELIGTEEIAVGAVGGLQVRTVGAAIAALVQHEHVEMRAVIERAIDPARFDDAFAHRIHLVEGARRRGPPAE